MTARNKPSKSAREAVCEFTRRASVHTNSPETHLEIEVRLCTRNTLSPVASRYDSGVTKTLFEETLCRLESYKEWDTVSEWVETHDTFFAWQDRNTTVRSSVHYAGDETLDAVHIETARKELQGPVYVFAETQDSSLAVKLSLCREIRVETIDMPTVVTPTHVRIKQRKSFRLLSSPDHLKSSGGGGGGGGGGNVAFRYDLSRVWSGRNSREADLRQRVSDPIYEIEVELLVQSGSISYGNASPAAAAAGAGAAAAASATGPSTPAYISPRAVWSLVCKALDLVRYAQAERTLQNEVQLICSS